MDLNYKERVRQALQAMPQMTADEFYSQMSRSMGTPLKYIIMTDEEIQSCPECDALASHGYNDGPCDKHINMRYKSVEELKEHILSEIEDGDIFEEYLFKKYPRLFPTDENGELLPQSQRCWNDCPVGWMSIVDSLFGCIDDYVQNHVHTKPNPKHKIRLACRRWYWKRVRDPIFRRINPYDDFEKRLPKGAKFASPNQQELLKIKASWKGKVRSAVSHVDNLLFNRPDLYMGVKCPAVTIDQYKEKFATLRVYHSGGNDVVDGMIRYAEHLSSLTCQYTGKEGKMYKRGMWYATLSPEEAEKIGYKPVEE